MTIPIVPGPFSFLPGAADVVNKYVQTRDFMRRRSLEDDFRTIGMLLQLNQQGVVDSKAFAGEGVISTLQRIGLNLNPQDVVPSFEAEKSRFLTQFSQSLGEPPVVPTPGAGPSSHIGFRPGGPTERRFPTAQRLLYGAPTGKEVAEAELGEKVATRREAAVGGEAAASPAEASVTGVPTEGQAAAGEAATIRQLLAPLASDAAASAVTAVGVDKFIDRQGNVTPEARRVAWEQAQQAATSMGLTLDPAKYRPLIDSALEQRRYDLRAQEIQSELAQARQFGLQSGTLDDLRKRLQDQVDNANSSIKTLQDGVSALHQATHRSVAQRIQQLRNEGATDDDIRRQIPASQLETYLRVEDVNAQIRSWEQRRDADYNSLQNLLSAAGGGAPAPAAPAGGNLPGVPALNEQQFQSALNYLKTSTDPERDIAAAVAAGEISTADADKLREAIKGGSR